MFRLCLMDFWLWHWSFKEAILPLLWGWGHPVTCPKSHHCNLDSSWWGRPSWSLLLPTLLTPLPVSLPFMLDGHGGTSPGPGFLSFWTFHFEGRNTYISFSFLFLKQICINHFEHTFSNYNLDSRMQVASILQQPLWFALIVEIQGVSSVSPSFSPPAQLTVPSFFTADFFSFSSRAHPC